MKSLIRSIALTLATLLSFQAVFAGQPTSPAYQQLRQTLTENTYWAQLSIPEKRAALLQTVDTQIAMDLIVKAEQDPEAVLHILNNNGLRPEYRLALYKAISARYNQINRSINVAVAKKSMSMDELDNVEKMTAIAGSVLALDAGTVGLDIYRARAGKSALIYRGERGRQYMYGSVLTGLFAFAFFSSGLSTIQTRKEAVNLDQDQVDNLMGSLQRIRDLNIVLTSQLNSAADELILQFASEN